MLIAGHGTDRTEDVNEDSRKRQMADSLGFPLLATVFSILNQATRHVVSRAAVKI